MKITGRYTFNAPTGKVWAAIYNPSTLLKIIPGCQQIEQISPVEYHGQFQLRLPAVVGAYQTYVKMIESQAPNYSRFEGEVEGTLGVIKGAASFWLYETAGQTIIEYEGQGLITGSLARLDNRFAEGLAKSLINQGLAKLHQQLQTQEGGMKIVDLSVPIGPGTLSPPSVNTQLQLTSYHRGPGFWQASKIEMVLHTGSHVDFTKHVQADGETAIDVALERVCGPALVIDLSFAQANHRISVADLEAYAPEIEPGDIVLVRTDWTEKQWGNFPTYYLESPYCSPEAAQWLVDQGAKAIGFDCFSEYCARLPNFTSEEFIIHKIILENGAILMQQLTNFSQLPANRRFQFFAPFIKIDGAEGSPARFFALLDEF
jgi:kynurenine formamidase/carbon monoxide dehydrogenase subunit G